MKKLLFFLTGALAFASCVVDSTPIDHPVPPVVKDGLADVSFVATMPVTEVKSTRAEGSASENKVENVYVLVFEPEADGDLVYKGKGRGLTPTNGSSTTIGFTATLPVNKAYDFMVLTNSEEALNSVSVTDTDKRKSTVMARLSKTTAAAAGWSVDAQNGVAPIPMWGEQRGLTLTGANPIEQPFALTRMVAKVNVKYSPTNAAVDNFRIASIRVYNYSKAGAIVPSDANITDNGQGVMVMKDGSTVRPSSPTSTGGYQTSTTADGPIVYNAAGTGTTSMADAIYLFEAAHKGKYTSTGDTWIQNPCLVIGGYFKPEGGTFTTTPTYYRVDFVKKGSTGNTQDDEWYDVVRNYLYDVQITEVSGEGYEDPDTALKTAPFNMTANVLKWEQRDMGNVVFDGVFYLSVSRDEFVFQRRGAEEAVDGYNTLKIKTDFLFNSDPADAKSGWRVDRIVKAGTEEPLDGAWLFLNPETRPSGWRPDDVNDAFFDIKENTSGADREADVWIKAGRLEYKVHVVQKILSLDVLDRYGEKIPDNTITHIVDDNGHSLTGIYHGFMLEWSRGSLPVTVTGKNNANNPYLPAWVKKSDTSWGAPNVFPDPAPYGTIPGPQNEKTIPGQTTPVGEIFFDVDAEGSIGHLPEFKNDPFYDAYSTYYFKVTNNAGGVTETLTDSIVLRKVHYDILADQHKYRLDGGVHNLTVRSNANWEIVDIKEYLFNSEQPTPPNADGSPIMIDFSYAYDNFKKGLHFGPNVNGTALSFHVVNNEADPHTNKWGSVKVWLKMTAPSAGHGQQGPTKTIEVTMIFPPASKLLIGLGYHDQTYAVNPAFPTDWHNNSAQNMLTSPYNFGSMDESLYQVEGFRVVGHSALGLPNYDPNGLLQDRHWHKYSMRNWLNDDSPDVIVLGDYDSDGYIARYTENEIRLLDQYVDNGGALIIMQDGGGSALYTNSITTRFLELILDKPYGSFNAIAAPTTLASGVGKWNEVGQTYTLNNVDDPILKGPFGDVRGKLWGAHYGVAGVRTDLLGPDIVPLSSGLKANGTGNAGYTTIFRHKTKNVVFIGNGGFVATSYPIWQQGGYPEFAPFACDQDNYFKPETRVNWGPPGSRNANEVENARVFANAVAWALTVTNHQPPEGKYKNFIE